MSNWDHELGRQFGNKNIEAGLILYLKKNVIYEAALANKNIEALLHLHCKKDDLKSVVLFYLVNS